MDEEFASHWKSYVLQSLLATLAIFVALFVFTMQHPVIIASIGATAFIVRDATEHYGETEKGCWGASGRSSLWFFVCPDSREFVCAPGSRVFASRWTFHSHKW